MDLIHRRSRYQAGSLTIEKRKTGVEVYIFRWREPIGNGRNKQRKVVLGTVKELNKTQARKKADEDRRQADTARPVRVELPRAADTTLTVAELVEHYKVRELGVDAGNKL